MVFFAIVPKLSGHRWFPLGPAREIWGALHSEKDKIGLAWAIRRILAMYGPVAIDDNLVYDIRYPMPCKLVVHLLRSDVEIDFPPVGRGASSSSRGGVSSCS